MKEKGNKQFWDRWPGYYNKFMRSNGQLYNAIVAKMKRRLTRKIKLLQGI